MTAGRPDVAVLGAIPDDMREAVGEHARLLDLAALTALDADRRGAIDRALSSAMGGAPPDRLDLLPGLETIVSIGAGMDLYDEPALSARGIRVCPTPDVMTEDTAEMAVGLVFALLRRLVFNDGVVRRGDWAQGRPPPGRRISGRRVGIVGLGRIGGRVADKLAGLGCDIAYTGRVAKPGVRWRFAPDAASLATKVDVLILTCAGGPGTERLVDAEVLSRLGPDGFLVNVSRGSVVDEEALISALERNAIAGAALDVFGNEPHPDPRFAALSDTVLQPHASVFTQENRRDLAAELIRLLTVKA